LLALGVLFMIGEALAPSFGALGIGGVLAFGLGSVLLFEAEGPGFELSIMLVGGVTAASLVIFMGTATLAMRAFQRRGVAGVSHLLDTEAEVVATEPALRVVTESERWRAQSDYDLAIGDRVKVTDIDGLTLTVEPTDKRDNKRHE
jgi:membrane-bound serine protease (ClpP class)